PKSQHECWAAIQLHRLFRPTCPPTNDVESVLRRPASPSAGIVLRLAPRQGSSWELALVPVWNPWRGVKPWGVGWVALGR
ncbi:hypothetical protein JMJ77_0011752, partial [Colletotrichum scovillei]